MDTLTNQEKDHLKELNSRNGYGISITVLCKLISQHRRAFALGDRHTMAKIEYRLNDINFHSEVGLLMSGNYEDALRQARGL